MRTIIEDILRHVLMALYQPFWFSVIMAVLTMFFLMFAKEKGFKSIIKKWVDNFKTSSEFRRVFLLVFYTTMIMFRTLLNRNLWANPLINIVGIWGIYDAEDNLTTETIENLMLFIPFAFLLLWALKDKIIAKRHKSYWLIIDSTLITFLISTAIEFIQLFLRLGAFQLSDIFFNTVGGFIGGLAFTIIYIINKKLSK